LYRPPLLFLGALIQLWLVGFSSSFYHSQYVWCCLHGVLAQAKSGDQLFWEVKFHASNGRPKHALKVPYFFSFKVLGGWGRRPGGEKLNFFFLGSQCVPTMFTLSSQWVPQCILHSTSLLSHTHWQIVVLLSPVQVSQRGRNSILQNRTSYFRELHRFHFFF
jgi:hypothetical protein